MLAIDELEKKELRRIRIACKNLFPLELATNSEFIASLNSKTIKNAYRAKARRYYTDLHRDEPSGTPERRIKRFKSILRSYKLLISNLKERAPGKVIAVGGAKGGIGKSLFAANLGVILSSIGLKTVVLDLDLGGANLHFYLGETALEREINDFLNGTFPAIEEIAIESKYGPRLIGGDSSQLGVANIAFSQKLKLLRAIKDIDADYVIIDLGGDTNYNIIDFFLSADHKVVLTTRDPASYLDAYRFIKVSLFRKLNRLFGSESEHRAQKDTELEALLHDATMSSKESDASSISELLERVNQLDPGHVPLIESAIAEFKPQLVVNKAPAGYDTTRIAEHINSVSKKVLSLSVSHIGDISLQPEIEESALVLVPVVSTHPDGACAREIRSIASKLLYK